MTSDACFSVTNHSKMINDDNENRHQSLNNKYDNKR